MGADRVLIAYSNNTGSTAGIAEAIAGVLLSEGLVVECRQARAVVDVTPYSAVILGSGVFVPSRASDGGGFLTRHATALAARPIWLFCAGPIGRGRSASGVATAPSECSVTAVASAVGARGSAVFGPIGMPDDSDPIERLGPPDLARVRGWAAEIAAELVPGQAGQTIARSRVPGRRRLVAAG